MICNYPSDFITSNNIFKSKDRLILDIGYDYIALKYQGKEVYLCKDNYDESDKIKKELLGEWNERKK